MAPTQLEDVMNAFYEGQYDVLLSTTIVESGLDIPAANTLIVHRAGYVRPVAALSASGPGGSRQDPRLRLSHNPYREAGHAGSREAAEGAGNPWTVWAPVFNSPATTWTSGAAATCSATNNPATSKEIGVELYQQMLEDAVAELRQGGAEAVQDGPRLVAADQRGRRRADPRGVCAGPERPPVSLPAALSEAERPRGSRGPSPPR